MPKQTFIGRVIATSTKAIFFQDWFWWNPLWLPLSQIDIEEDPEGDEKIVRVSHWLSTKNDLREFTEYDEKSIEERGFKD